MISLTFCVVGEYARPKSPWSTPVIHFWYCTITGSSRWRSCWTRATDSLSAHWGPRIWQAGSPGSSCVSRNVRNDRISRTPTSLISFWAIPTRPVPLLLPEGRRLDGAERVGLRHRQPVHRRLVDVGEQVVGQRDGGHVVGQLLLDHLVGRLALGEVGRAAAGVEGRVGRLV